jgi:hypothetical protein
MHPPLHELAQQAMDLALGKPVRDVSTTKFGYRRVAHSWLRRVSEALTGAASKVGLTFYTTNRRSYEVEVKENDEGDVVLYVGGFPVLYLDPEDCCLHLVPNDTGEAIGLAYRGKAVGGTDPCVRIIRDRAR